MNRRQRFLSCAFGVACPRRFVLGAIGFACLSRFVLGAIAFGYLSACSAQHQALVDSTTREAIAARQAFNDTKATALLAAVCDIQLGSRSRIVDVWRAVGLDILCPPPGFSAKDVVLNLMRQAKPPADVRFQRELEARLEVGRGRP
jgi:hypothetical protein